ncbi:MAG TPA: AAA family ATPase, partial [bacterium]|nr:AAA family ATPase [bacterium]
MKKLPLGKQDFRDLIDGNFIYVDKTKWIHQMLKDDVPYFMSRPRRFGKTLTVSTLHHLFKGHQDLFKNTFIYDKWNFQERSVIRLNMNEVNSSEGAEIFKNELFRVIKNQSKINNVKLSESLYSAAFQELIGKLDKPAILIDEYDKPILSNIHKPEYVDQIREILKEFYGAIKTKESNLSFIFITGISKFSKMSIFS